MPPHLPEPPSMLQAGEQMHKLNQVQLAEEARKNEDMRMTLFCNGFVSAPGCLNLRHCVNSILLDIFYLDIVSSSKFYFIYHQKRKLCELHGFSCSTVFLLCLMHDVNGGLGSPGLA
jgi:hypothetical protein